MPVESTERKRYTAFAGTRKLATGTLHDVAEACWRQVATESAEPLTLFDDSTGRSIDIDLTGCLEAVLSRLPSDEDARPERRLGPGRPKLGVVSREVSLLPRHWEWLASQPGGASVALRKLVETARKENLGSDRARRCREAAHSFMWSMAGDLQGFEEASRALFAADYSRLEQLMAPWPRDVREHARELVSRLVEAEHATEERGVSPQPSTE